MDRWRFWIDVGGTFTDCLGARSDGGLQRAKVLSSGRTPGRVAAGSTNEMIFDPARRRDPPDFWIGAQLQLLDSQGKSLASARVERFDAAAGALRLSAPLPMAPQAGQGYELITGEEAPLLAIRRLLGLAPGRLPPIDVMLGTTRGTNALLTRRGARTALLTTRGFADLLRIGNQNRPKLFELAIRRPEPLFAEVIEVDERLADDGQVLRAPNEAIVCQQLADLRRGSCESLAICFLHAYREPRHEALVAEWAREAGFTEISVSHQVAPLIKMVSRGDTTTLDAYLTPVLRAYVGRLAAGLNDSADTELGKPSSLRLLTSAGGLAAADQFSGKDSILSGPAGGVVGASRVAEAAGFPRSIGFDMGGTSTDVSRYDGRLDLEYETEKGGVRVMTPMLAIETVAAGGGSICWCDGVKLVVGPQSAGADPGPACYGRGGPLTVTDLNLVLGRISTEHFPIPLDRGASEQRLATMAEEVAAATGVRYSLPDLAAGFLAVANATMVRAIRSVSVAKGYDPRAYVLVAFGGAAGQHACAVADALGMKGVLCHPDAGLLSAYGIGLADVVRHRARGIYAPWGPDSPLALAPIAADLAEEARAEVRAEEIPDARIETRRSLDLRYRGTDASLSIPWTDAHDPAADFAAEHRRRFGYDRPGRALEVVAIRIEAIGRSAAQLPPSRRLAPTLVRPSSATEMGTATGPVEAPVYLRADLSPGAVLRGPALVVEFASTTVIESAWQGVVLSGGELLLEIAKADAGGSAASIDEATTLPAAPADPVLLEVFHHHFGGIAEEMGLTLRQTSVSVNVKERLDFSCAIFTARGELVVNAPHIPVHLGAMGETVRALIADNPDLAPGDVLITNDPYRGGSHLPDVTVVTPVHDPATREVLFFTASRAHHAEIGGIVPGSMPPFSKTLAEEGVVIRNFKVIAGRTGAPGSSVESRFEELRGLLASPPFPSRAIDDNLADIAAQIAANQRGARDLLQLVERHSWPVVSAYMRHIQDAAERKMRAALARLPQKTYRFTDHLDDGSPISVAIALDGGNARIDFAGSGPVVAGNLNANRAIVTAAVMYVLRLLIDEDIPLNHGVLAPVEIVIPPGLLSPPAAERPEDCPAVVGGNVETSQRVVDVLLGALGLAAASQGTMNNLLFGDATFGYYETICGGSGATPQADGTSAVHTHMTNTRLTDPEVLEQRYPVRLHEFAIRRGSGGAGAHRGGDGAIRRIEFLRPLEVSLLGTRRGPYPPYGLAGGEPGALGINQLTRSDGTTKTLPGATHFQAAAGEILTIETPGGGGFGKATA